MPTSTQFQIAIEWLRLNEGDEGESDACAAVADMLEREMKRRARDATVRKAARENGVPYRTAARAYDTVAARNSL